MIFKSDTIGLKGPKMAKVSQKMCRKVIFVELLPKNSRLSTLQYSSKCSISRKSGETVFSFTCSQPYIGLTSSSYRFIWVWSDMFKRVQSSLK